MSGIYDVTLAPGATDRIQAVGTRAKVLTAAAGAVAMRLDTGETYTLMEGQGVRNVDGKEFGCITIRNLATIAQTITVFAGDDGFEDSRITGTVAIVDGSAVKAVAGKSFTQSRTSAADGANMSVVSLYANGKQVALRRIIFQSGVAGSIVLGFGTSTGTATAGGAAMQNLNIGGAASTAQVMAGLTAGAVPTGTEIPGYVGFDRLYLTANLPFDLKLDTPIIISGTQLLSVHGQVINRDVSAVFFVDELT